MPSDRSRLSLLLTFAALGCGSAAERARVETTSPEPSPVTTGVASAASTADEAAPPPPMQAHALVQLDQAPTEIELFPIGDTIVVIADGPDGTGNVTNIGEVTGGKIAWRKELDLKSYAQGVTDIDGTYPDKLLMTYVFDHGRSADQVLYTTQKTGWTTREKRFGYEHFLYQSATLAEGSVVAVTADAMRKGGLITAHGLAKPPRIRGADRCGPEGPFLGIVETTPKGTLVAAGSCGDKHAVATWPAGSDQGDLTVLDLPGTDRNARYALIRGRGDGAWLMFGQHLVRFQDGRWSPPEVLPDMAKEHEQNRFADAGAESDTGELWLLRRDTDRLYRKKPGATWERVAVAPGVRIDNVVSQNGKILVAAANLLLGQGEGKVDWANVKVDRDEKKRVTRARPASPDCKTNVVVLYGFTKVTPDDYDFPLTRKALKGKKQFADVKFAVTREAGQKFFVGLTDSFTRGRALADVIRKDVQGSSPQVVCAEPELVRELKIDLATGDVLP